MFSVCGAFCGKKKVPEHILPRNFEKYAGSIKMWLYAKKVTKRPSGEFSNKSPERL